jgi:hypothetical protein
MTTIMVFQDKKILEYTLKVMACAFNHKADVVLACKLNGKRYILRALDGDSNNGNIALKTRACSKIKAG